MRAARHATRRPTPDLPPRDLSARAAAWPRCDHCPWPLNPAAAQGGHTTHPGCDPHADPRPLATAHQLPIAYQEH
jgi:hypothetical protein